MNVRFESRRDAIPAAEFMELKTLIDRKLGPMVQAYALTWARPYRVSCMSITAAFAFGMDVSYCASGCKATERSPYFNSPTRRPYDDLHIRPAMSLAALDFEKAKALIDRGTGADGTAPQGTAYLVVSGDAARDVRAAEYRLLDPAASRGIKIELVEGGPVHDRADVLFYFVGAAAVSRITSNRFLPGAIADHLTSYGGRLTDSRQMSAVRWLEAGATGSYGTTSEPCNILGKFPYIPVLVSHYLAGETLIEAYWKSVAMPGQGLFIGEPLAAPFRR